MLQGEQRRTYLSDKGSLVGVSILCLVGVGAHVAEMNPDDMAGLAAATDASPQAAVLLLSWLPRGEDVCRVAGDASFELQQSVPLMWPAADGTRAIVGTTTL